MTALEMLEGDPLLTTEQVAARYGYHPQSIRNMLHKGTGPKAVRLPNRSIRYRCSDLLRWEIGMTDEPAKNEVAA